MLQSDRWVGARTTKLDPQFPESVTRAMLLWSSRTRENAPSPEPRNRWLTGIVIGALCVTLCVAYSQWFDGRMGGRADRFVRAAAQGDITVVSSLLDSGINPNATNSHGTSALAAAAGEGQIETVRQLLESGATAQPGVLPAATFGRAEVLDYLLGHGAMMDGKIGPLALEAAIRSRSLATVRCLVLRSVPLKVTFGDKALPPVALAASLGQSSICGALALGGAEVGARSRDGRTALMWAAASDSPDAGETCRYLIRAGISVNEQDKQGRTALMLSVNSYPEKPGSRPAPLDILLQAGADRFLRDNRGQTALHYADQYHKTRARARLLRKH